MSTSLHTLQRRATRNKALFSTKRARLADPTGLPTIDRVLQAIALAAVLSVVLALSLKPLSHLWQFVCNELISALSLQADVVVRTLHIGQASLGARLGIHIATHTPDSFELALHGVMCVGVFGMSWAVRSMPLRSGLRILSVIHGIGIGVIAGQGNAFPYDALSHTRVIYDASLIGLLVTPTLLAAGFFLVERSMLNRLTGSALILGFQILALPIKLVLHSVLITLLSPAIIPLLFLALGPVLDLLLIAALYAWVLTWPQLKFKLK